MNLLRFATAIVVLTLTAVPLSVKDPFAGMLVIITEANFCKACWNLNSLEVNVCLESSLTLTTSSLETMGDLSLLTMLIL